jgi:hypothetical protein
MLTGKGQSPPFIVAAYVEGLGQTHSKPSAPWTGRGT